MTTLALLISLVSLTLAGGMAIVVSRVLRDERRRSDARVAALSRMAEVDFLPEPEPSSDPPPMAVETSTGLFAEIDSPSPWGARLAIAGALTVLVLVLSAMALFRSRLPADAGTPSAVDRQATEAAAPLELLALGHTQESGSLTVSGRVQNPRGGQPAPSLTATVFLFGPDGSFLTSGRSSLDVQPLGAGDESAFIVSVPVNGAVARYRVSFRDSAGRAVAHVDRRRPAALVRNE
jgi:hypothetical protein